MPPHTSSPRPPSNHTPEPLHAKDSALSSDLSGKFPGWSVRGRRRGPNGVAFDRTLAFSRVLGPTKRGLRMERVKASDQDEVMRREMGRDGLAATGGEV